MRNNNHSRSLTHLINLLTLMICMAITSSCKKSQAGETEQSVDRRTVINQLHDSLQSIISDYDASIGIALLTDRGDTLVLNNNNRYALMSVFKLHQAISLCHNFEQDNRSLDTIVSINRNTLNQSTWSPMLKDYHDDTIKVSIRQLLDYALTMSDNNASNYLFDNIEPVEAVDSFIATIVPRPYFKLQRTEQQMFENHGLCFDNRSTPLGAAILIERLFTDSIFNTPGNDYIRTALVKCLTGKDRIAAPFADKPQVTVAHKTGSGYRDDNGLLKAHNDVAFVRLPDGHHYTLAVLIRDFAGSDAAASDIIARISASVYDVVCRL